MTNKEHVGRNKNYYVVESPEVLLFLQKYDDMNLQRLRPDQLKQLKDKGLVDDNRIQNPHEYKPNAIVFINDAGEIRIKKVTSLMIALGIWKSNKKG